MAELLADDFWAVTIAVAWSVRGIQHGRDAEHIADMRTIVDLWVTNVSSTIVATRGERLVLMRTHFSGSDQGPGAFLTGVFGLVEIDTDQRIVVIVSFDLDDFDAAIDELDARYLAGEAAAQHAGGQPSCRVRLALNRRERPRRHRTWSASTIGEAERSRRAVCRAYLRATWDVTPRTALIYRQGCASGERHRRGRHLRGERDHGRGLRRRVACDRPCSWPRATDQPVRAVRRERPRRRARVI